MTLTTEQMLSFTCGAVSAVFEDGVYKYTRFSPDEVEAFAALVEVLGTRARSTTGIRLEFETDSKTIRVDVKNPGTYEILVDGLQVAHQECCANEAVFAELGEGNKHVTVMLPWHTEGALNGVLVDDGSYVRPHKFDRTFLFLGDSITQGASAKHDNLSYACRVARWFNADYVNLGVGGSKFYPTTLTRSVCDPDTIFLAYGTNDFNSIPSMQILHDNCKRYMDLVQKYYPGKPVYCITPLWRLDGTMVRPAGSLDQVREMIIGEIEAHGFTHIDGYKLVPHDSSFFADKRLHPDDLGMSIYAEQLIRQLVQKYGF